MAKFASTYPDDEFVQTVSAQISWSHNIAIIDKVKDQQKRIWYINQSYANGWSHDVLIHQIETDLYGRQALSEKVSNFPARLPSVQSDLAIQMMKDPYVFDFVSFKADIVERDIEQALIADVTKLLLELGTGFAFLGNQYHLNVGGDDFYIDLLFYNLNLRCYVVIELKPASSNLKRFTHVIVDSIPETIKLVILVGPNDSGSGSPSRYTNSASVILLRLY